MTFSETCLSGMVKPCHAVVHLRTAFIPLLADPVETIRFYETCKFLALACGTTWYRIMRYRLVRMAVCLHAQSMERYKYCSKSYFPLFIVRYVLYEFYRR